jgi:hypothetical protein
MLPETCIRHTSLLTEEFVSILAEHSHSTVHEIYDMFSSCALCQQDVVFPVVVLEGESWFADSDSGKLRLALYGLCQVCAAQPDIIQTINRKLFLSR